MVYVYRRDPDYYKEKMEAHHSWFSLAGQGRNQRRTQQYGEVGQPPYLTPAEKATR
jgi:hypothetical protein